MAKHSPLYVTGITMAIGTALYAVGAIPDLLATRWADVRLMTWVLLVGSALMALNFGYVVWNAAVQRLGATHTAIYSNLVPVAALIVATLWLGEPLTPTKSAAA